MHYEKDYLQKHYLRNKKPSPLEQPFASEETLGKFYKKVPANGIILMRNPGLPSPDVLVLELVVLEKFSGNRNESWNLLVQDKILLNSIKFGQDQQMLYETESERVVSVCVGLHLPDKAGCKEVQSLLAERARALESTGRDQATAQDLADKISQFGILDSQDIQKSGRGLGPGGSDGKKGRLKNAVGQTSARESNQTSSQKIKIEMTGGNEHKKGLTRMGTLDKKAEQNIITKNSRIDYSNIIDLDLSTDRSGSSRNSEMSRELDNILENLDQRLAQEERIKRRQHEQVPSFNFQRFSIASDFRNKRVLSNAQRESLLEAIFTSLVHKQTAQPEYAKRLKALYRSGQKILEQNMVSFSYLLGVFDGNEDRGYFRERGGTGKPKISNFMVDNGLVCFKKSGIELTRRTWQKLAEVALGEKVLGFTMNYFVFGNNFDDRFGRRNFLKQEYYPLEQYVLVHKFAKSEAIWGKINNIFILQILQLGARNSQNYLDFLFDFFHWLELTFPGQSQFIHQDYLVELVFCLFYFNQLPVTREFLDLNMSSLLGLDSDEARDIYEYYRYINPIKNSPRQRNKRKMLLKWIRIKERLQQDPQYATGCVTRLQSDQGQQDQSQHDQHATEPAPHVHPQIALSAPQVDHVRLVLRIHSAQSILVGCVVFIGLLLEFSGAYEDLYIAGKRPKQASQARQVRLFFLQRGDQGESDSRRGGTEHLPAALAGLRGPRVSEPPSAIGLCGHIQAA